MVTEQPKFSHHARFVTSLAGLKANGSKPRNDQLNGDI